MNAFTRAVDAELRKIFSTRLWWMLALICFSYISLSAGSFAALLGAVNSGILPPESANLGGIPNDPALIYSMASSIGFVFPLLFASMSVTQEFRHKTLTPTFLAQPKRGIVLLAKLFVSLLSGAFFGTVALVAALGVGAAVLAAFGEEPQLDTATTWLLAARIVLAMALWGVIGTGVGVLIPSQIASITVVLAFTQFVEPLLRLAGSVVSWGSAAARVLPGAASDALVGASVYSFISPGETLTWWQGALALGVVAAVTTSIGYLRHWRADVS